MFELITDLVRVAHFIGFAIGIGAAVFLEGLVLSRARVAIEEEELALIEHGHRLILGALGVLWLTGLALVGLKTGFDPALITGKLQAKMWIVAALTANAFVIAWVATPLLRNALYRSLSDMPVAELAMIGAAAGLSAAGWISALVLGAVGHLAALSFDTLGPVFFGVLIAGAVGGAIFAVIVGQREPAEIKPGASLLDPILARFRKRPEDERIFARMPPREPR
ncbi:MAG: hypothetical protein AAF401_18360 [Pseudomonadota bacterium]